MTDWVKLKGMRAEALKLHDEILAFESIASKAAAEMQAHHSRIADLKHMIDAALWAEAN